jgi:hypothetical protein
MIENVTPRSIRCFNFYKSQHLVLTVEDRPGRLQSTAAPPPDGFPAHPFMNARAFDPYSEDELGWLAQKAASFDGFVEALIAAGYNAASGNGSPPDELWSPHRILDPQGVTGALWAESGQFACLWRQPEPGQLVFQHATVTVYRRDHAEAVFEHLQATRTFEALLERLEALNLRVEPLSPYIV